MREKKVADDIRKRFTHHPPRSELEVEFYEEYRYRAAELARFLVTNVPDTRERSVALTKLEEAVMWGNAGVARNGLAPEAGG